MTAYMTGADDKAAADALKASGHASADEPDVMDCGKYAGMTAAEARKAIVADLQEAGYLKEIEPLKHEVGTCYRCHTVIEPMVSKQWFVKMETLAKPAIESRKGRDQVCAGPLYQELPELDARQPRLVHQPPAVVGPPDPGMVLR